MTVHGLIYTFSSALFALFPVINPIGDSLIVNRHLDGLSERDKKEIIRRIVLNCIIVGFAAVILGHIILLIFNLAIPVIQLAGGILICQVGLDGLWSTKGGGDQAQHFSPAETDARAIRNETFYPLSFPVCLGPGTISVIFSLMANSSVKEDVVAGIINYGIIMLAVFILCGCIYLCCLQGEKLIQRLGEAGSLIINKLVSFLTFCVGLQIIVTGIASIFHLQIL